MALIKQCRRCRGSPKDESREINRMRRNLNSRVLQYGNDRKEAKKSPVRQPVYSRPWERVKAPRKEKVVSYCPQLLLCHMHDISIEKRKGTARKQPSPYLTKNAQKRAKGKKTGSRVRKKISHTNGIFKSNYIRRKKRDDPGETLKPQRIVKKLLDKWGEGKKGWTRVGEEKEGMLQGIIIQFLFCHAASRWKKNYYSAEGGISYETGCYKAKF